MARRRLTVRILARDRRAAHRRTLATNETRAELLKQMCTGAAVTRVWYVAWRIVYPLWCMVDGGWMHACMLCSPRRNTERRELDGCLQRHRKQIIQARCGLRATVRAAADRDGLVRWIGKREPHNRLLLSRADKRIGAQAVYDGIHAKVCSRVGRYAHGDLRP